MGSSYLLILMCFLYQADAFIGLKTNANYGPYMTEFSNYRDCKGPKSENVAHCAVDLNMDGTQPQIGKFNLTVFEHTSLDEIKITVYSMTGTRKSTLWSYRLNNPCQHMIVASAIESRLHTKNCVVKKGNYVYEINYTELTRSFFGESFFYGEFDIKALVLSKKGNIMCQMVYTTIKKVQP